MALWGGLGQAATVAQLVGVDVGGLISMIIKAAMTAQQNKKECEQLARRVFMIAELLPHMQDPEIMGRPEIRRPLVGLDDTLREAHELVMSCQEKNAVYQLVMAGRQADKFREVQSRIDSYLLVFPFISHIDVTRRLDRIYNILLPNDMTVPSSSEGSSHSHHMEYAEDVAQEMLLPHGKEDEKFTFAELEAATINFAPDREIGKGGSSTVYMGRLADGREVAIKHFSGKVNIRDFQAEYTIVSHVRHKNIIRLLGCCLERHEKKITRSRWFQKRKLVDVLVPLWNPLLVFDCMKNGSLDKHLHGPLSSSSPVTTSWSMRMEILLGVSRAIEYLHTHAERPVIHRDIKPSNILLDGVWVPHLSDFGFSVTCGNGNGNDPDPFAITIPFGTMGYIDPEYYMTGCLKTTSDVYNFGVVMLELLTGLRAMFRRKGKEGEENGFTEGLVHHTLPIIEAGELRKVLDRRPASEPTPRQLQALELVAQTAVCCLGLNGEDRPAISDIVAKLQAALDLLRDNE